MKYLDKVSLLIAFVFFTNGYAQVKNTETNFENLELKGTVVDTKNNEALSYVNILILKHKKGTVTNEKGDYLLNARGLKKTDTIRFQYIGYKIKNVTVADLVASSKIILEEDIFNMNEVFILGNAPNPEDIVKQVLKNKDANYKILPRKEQTFIRKKSHEDIIKLAIDYKKGNIEDLDEKMLATFQDKVPKSTTSYSDFLGVIYSKKNEDEGRDLKLDPIKKVNLKSKEIAEIKQFDAILEGLIKDTGKKEYWKIKSGIFGKKIEMDRPPENDTLKKKEKDSLHKDTHILKYYRNYVKHLLDYSTFKDKKKWHFLYKTNSYEYNLEGGTTMNGEDVYVIDFVPKKKGMYEGRLYISIETSALIRADYKFAPGKLGRDFHLLGYSQTNTHFNGSVYFEKKNGNYVLKYFSHKRIDNYGLNRKLALQKKKNRFLFDKKLKELKIRLDIAVKSEYSIEYLVIDSEEIAEKEFDAFKQKERMKVIFVDQFDEDLWKGYSIIEPTKKMREYKKVSE